MKKNLLKGIITFIFLISNIMVFAQTGPGTQDNTGTGNLEGTLDPDPTAANIDTNLYLYLIVGVIIAMYFIIKKNKTNVTN